MRDLLRIGLILDNSGQYKLSDKLYKIAQQGRLNLDNQTGINNFRQILKSLIGKSLVRSKINPLEFVIDFEKLNSLLNESPLKKYVIEVKDVSPFNKENKKLYDEDPVKGNFDYFEKKIYIPKKYNSRNLATYLHEVVHSIDPVTIGKSLRLKEENAQDMARPYYSQSAERLANFENLDYFYSSEKFKKILETFYIKDKKKYPTTEIATKAFMDDMKNYFQNPKQSILFQTSRFHNYLVAVNNNDDEITPLLANAFGPLNEEQLNKIIGDLDPKSSKAGRLYIEYLKQNPTQAEPRDIKYYNQMQKFFTNIYNQRAKEMMPSYNPIAKPFNVNSSAKLQASKNWLVKYITKNSPKTNSEDALQALDYFIYQRRDLYNKFISTLRTLNIVLDESFNFQDPRWQLLEPIVEVFLNEFIKYLENPEAYKTNLTTDEQRRIKQLNDEINKIKYDDTIVDKRTYFLKNWNSALKTLGTLEQKELLDKLPITSIEKGLGIMKNIGQK